MVPFRCIELGVLKVYCLFSLFYSTIGQRRYLGGEICRRFLDTDWSGSSWKLRKLLTIGCNLRASGGKRWEIVV